MLPKAGNTSGEVTDGDLASLTPCASWTIDDLYCHMVEQNIRLGQAIDPNSAPPPPPGACMLRETVHRISARFASDALATAATTPERPVLWKGFGELPIALIRQVHLASTLIHTWDLTQATGFEFEAPGSDTIAEALDGMRELPARLRGSGKPFAGIVTFPALNAFDEVLTLSGRRPAWRTGPA